MRENLWLAIAEARMQRTALQKKINWIETVIHHLSELAKLQAVQPDFSKPPPTPEPTDGELIKKTGV